MYTKEQRRSYQSQYRARRRESAIEALGGCCVRCGSVKDLEFDHVDPSTKVCSIASMIDAAQDRFEEELAKCQLLCVNCHKDKTSVEISRLMLGREPANKIRNPRHGTERRYRDGCRCEPCKDWRRLYRAKKVDTMGNPL